MDVKLECKGCGNSFTVPFRANRIDKIKYCSITCFNSTKRKTVECLECGTGFTVPQSSTRTFCANTCYHRHRKAQKCQKTCEVCSKTFETTSTRKDTARFCSRECMGQDPSWKEAISSRMSGDKNWRWNGGKSKEVVSAYNRQLYRDVFTQHMRLMVPGHPFFIEKDGQKILSPSIHVHHIDRDPSNNEIGNLLAVTIDAHAKIHHNGRKPDPWECWPSNPERW